MSEQLKARICPGCGKLHAEVNLPHTILMYEPSLRNYAEVPICAPCHAHLRESVAAAVGKSSTRVKRKTPISE